MSQRSISVQAMPPKESVGEVADLLAGADGVAEEFLVAVVGVIVEIHLIGEG